MDENQQQEEVEAQPEEYIMWDGNLPEAHGKIAQAFATIPINTQLTNASSLFTFLQQESPVLSKLNTDTTLFTALVNIPDSDLIKVIYAMGQGTSGICDTSEIDGKLLTITGDPDGSQCPEVLAFPDTIIDSHDMVCPPDQDFKVKLAIDPNSWPL